MSFIVFQRVSRAGKYLHPNLVRFAAGDDDNKFRSERIGIRADSNDTLSSKSFVAEATGGAGTPQELSPAVALLPEDRIVFIAVF